MGSQGGRRATGGRLAPQVGHQTVDRQRVSMVEEQQAQKFPRLLATQRHRSTSEVANLEWTQNAKTPSPHARTIMHAARWPTRSLGGSEPQHLLGRPPQRALQVIVRRTSV